MRQFPAGPIRALIDQSPRYNLGESFGRHLPVANVLDPAELADLSLGYGTSAGDAEVRARVAERHGIPDGQVLLTTGAAAALFLVALLHSDGEILAGLPCYPPMLDAVRGVGARVVTVSHASRTAIASIWTPSGTNFPRVPGSSCSPHRRILPACRSRAAKSARCSTPCPAAAPRRSC
jgi:Aminotransferase class I and II